MKQIIRSALSQLRWWRSNPRVWAALLLAVGISIKNCLPYLRFANFQKSNVQIFEPYIVNGSNVYMFSSIILGGLLLLSDAPFITETSAYEVLRIGRKRWLMGKLIYLLSACLIYMCWVLVISVVLVLLNATADFDNRWSDALQYLTSHDLAGVSAHFQVSFYTPGFVREMSPLGAMLRTLFSHILYLWLLGSCMLTFNLWQGKGLGWISAAVLHIAGYTACLNASFWTYFLPLACALPTWQSSPEFYVTPQRCLLTILVPCLVLNVLCLRLGDKVMVFEGGGG